ncbi:MAG TPA: NBR1-Ig-like domain-containing protein [Anaerolineales bacterium]
MPRIISLFAILILTLTSCVEVSSEAVDTATPAPPLFVTATLPPTKQALTVPTQVPPTSTPEVSTTTTPGASSPASCRDSAILVEDVTYADNTRLNAGERFTKTWKLQNVGTCTWTGYTLTFVNGDRMGSPDSVPVPETERSKPVDVSVELTAPTSDGIYRGNYELRNSSGEKVLIGTESIFWVQIVVGAGVSSVGGTQIVQNNCTYTLNDGYVQTLIQLINQARADVGRAALTANAALMKAAQDHSLDMACNNFLNHSGSDGSWIGDRLVRVGYPNSYYLEIIAIGLPQDAMNQWRNDQTHWDAVINSRVREIGVGYVYSKFSSYGGYWTVDMGGP